MSTNGCPRPDRPRCRHYLSLLRLMVELSQLESTRVKPWLESDFLTHLLLLFWQKKWSKVARFKRRLAKPFTTFFVQQSTRVRSSQLGLNSTRVKKCDSSYSYHQPYFESTPWKLKKKREMKCRHISSSTRREIRAWRPSTTARSRRRPRPPRRRCSTSPTPSSTRRPSSRSIRGPIQ